MKAVFISEPKHYFHRGLDIWIGINEPKHYFNNDLTKGKTYEVLDFGNVYKIINDDGNLDWYYKSMFMPLEEWRDQQLNEILKEE